MIASLLPWMVDSHQLLEEEVGHFHGITLTIAESTSANERSRVSAGGNLSGDVF